MIKPFDQAHTRKARRKIAQFREIAQSFIFFVACLLQYTPQLTWRLQRMLLWSLSQWTVFGVCLNSWTNKRRRLMTILQHARLPFKFSWTWWTQTSVIYMRLDLWDADFYIGATEHSVFDREQSRMRKFRQLGNQQLAYFEPALKVWFHLNNFYRFGCFPLQQQNLDKLYAMETAFQTTYRPKYNWPWIKPFLQKFHIGKQRFGPSVSKPFLEKTRKFCRRYLKRTATNQRCVLGLRFHSADRIYTLLTRLGSDTIEKFHVSKLLRSSQTDIQYLFLLWRLSHQLGEPFRTRCQSQLRLILRFKGTESPPPNVPMRLQVLSDDMNDAIKQWLLNFTFHHSINFPPFHKVRAPFVRIKNRTLGQTFFNFRKVLKWWTPEQQPLCTCHLFPLHIRQRERKTEHISVFAQECFPDEAFLHQHMAEEISPSWRHFFHHNTYQFEQWLHRWKLSHSLIQYWQAFILTQWKIYKQNSLGQTQKQIQRLQHRLRSFVVSPSDHFPHSLTLHCPAQWQYLVNRTFLDTSVFLRCQAYPIPLLKHIQQNIPDWIMQHYKWGFKFGSTLSTAYILPKPSRLFQKARPIVDYSRAWCRPIGSALATALYEILQVVYSDLLSVTDIKSVLHAIAKLFSHQDYTYGELTVEQEDIAGFYNQVDHSRMLQAVQFAVCRFCELQGQTFDSFLNIHQETTERTLRIFRGFWRSHSHKYRPICLAHIQPLSQYLLNHSYFSIGGTVFQQRRGASMGSQWAPIFCSAVALLREWIFHSYFQVFRTNMNFHHRYVDNRLILATDIDRASLDFDLFWRLDFYTNPILLEPVPGDEALGYKIDCLQHTITLQLPWNEPLRHSSGCGVSRTALSGLIARIRLILTGVYPQHLHLPQIQDLIGLISSRDSALVTTDSARKTIMTVIHQVHPHLQARDVFRFA